jgi:hypothetical protein
MSLEGKSPEQIAALAALSDSLASDPKYAGDFKRLLKKQNPSLNIPDVELEDRIAASDEAHRKEIKELRDRDAQRDAERATDKVYEEVRDKGGCTTRASFVELVKYAQEKGFQTGSVSGLLMAASHKQAETEAAEPGPGMMAPGFQIDDNSETSKAFMKDPKGTANRIAGQVMKEIEKARAKGVPVH